jgi:hypothetical protein
MIENRTRTRRYGGRVVAIGVAAVGAAIAIAYSMVPGSGRAASTAPVAAVSGVHEVVGRQVYDTTPRKRAVAQCPAGEAAVGGGYILAGNFQNVSSAAPSSIPVVTESGPAYRGDIGGGTAPRLWSIVAIAPSNYSGSWGLTPKAVCVKATRR